MAASGRGYNSQNKGNCLKSIGDRSQPPLSITMSNKDNTNNQEPPKRNRTWLWILLVGVVIIGGICLWQNMKPKKIEPYSYTEYWQDSTDNEIDSANNVVSDTIVSETNKATAKSSSHQSSSSYSYDDGNELKDDPEYREGGKYDPAKYHTDYSEDQEERRRRFIDNDGFDDDDGYDEYRGYEHENERSAQWDD